MAITLTNPTGVATGQRTADISVTTDSSGGTVYAVATLSAAPPTATQIIAGQDDAGAAASWADASPIVASPGVISFSVVGLVNQTSYYFHFVHRPPFGADSNIATSTALMMFANMTSWPDMYVDAANGADSNAGTSTAPWRTLAKLAANMDAGAIGNISGEFHELFSITGVDAITLKQWPGKPQWVSRGDVIVPPGSWSLVSGTIYQTTLPTGVTARRVTWNWDANLTTDGLHFGDFTAGAFGALTAGQWAQSGTTLQISLGGAMADPTTGDIYSYIADSAAIVEIRDSIGAVVQDVEARLNASDPTATTGYGVKLTDCTNGQIVNCKVYDCATHSIGVVNGNVNIAQGAARITGCQCFGLHGGGVSGQNQIVFFAGGAGVTDAIGRNNTYHLYGTLDWSQQPINANRSIVGSFQHGGAAAVAGVKWISERWIGYNGHISQPFGKADAAGVPTDENDPTTYSVRYIDCRANNCNLLVIPTFGFLYNLSTERCFFDFTRAAREGGYDNSSNGRACVVVGDQNSPGAGTSRLLNVDSVYLLDNRRLFNASGVNVGEAAGVKHKDSSGAVINSAQMVLVGYKTRIINRNTTILALNNIGTNVSAFWKFMSVTTSVVKNTDCVIAAFNNFNGAGISMMNAGGAIGVAAMSESDGNLWWGVGVWSSNAAWDTQTEFASLIDANGVYLTNPDLANLTNTLSSLADAQPIVGGYVRSNPRLRTNTTDRGVNRRQYDGVLGAYQYGGDPRSRRAMSLLAAGIIERGHR